MKKILIMVVAGIGLFAATVFGVLAATGRLNHEGTTGIPLIGSMFPPEEEGAEDEGVETASGTSADEGGEKPLLGREEFLGLNTERVYEKPQSRALGHGEEPGADVDSEPVQDPGVNQHPRDGESPEDTNHRHVMEDLFGQGQYRAGRYFAFQPVPAGIDPDEMNEMWRRAKATLKDTEQRESALNRQEKLLAVREQDLHDREEALAKLMKGIEAAQRELDGRIVQFHNDVKMVRNSELEPLKEVGRTLASLDRETAAKLIAEWWKTEEDQDRALKILAVMDTESANGIVALLPLADMRDFLEKRLLLTREKDR